MTAKEHSNAAFKWGRLLDGHKIVTNDKELDSLQSMYGEFKDFDRLASLPNPARVGILDQYVAWLK